MASEQAQLQSLPLSTATTQNQHPSESTIRQNGFGNHVEAHPSKEELLLESPPLSSSSPKDTPIFSTDFVSPQVQAILPEGYTLRPLYRSDYYNSYLDVLRVLTTVGDISYSDWSDRFDWMATRGGEYFPIVICDDNGRVVGTGTLLVERKFIHGLGLVGHIEDIAVDTHQQGKKLGLRLIQALDYVAEKAGCYKTILDCSEHNEGFYVKCGFKRAGLEMAHYY